MSEISRERLFGFRHAFDSPLVTAITVTLVVLLLAAPLVVVILRRAGRLDDKNYHELIRRCVSWMVLVPLMLGPVLLGAAWFIAFVGILSILCYREFARATGQFRYRSVSATAVLGIAVITFAVLDHWYGLFVAAPVLTICIMAVVAILSDQPHGFIQRVALGVFALLFIGVGLAHLSYFANDANFRAIVIWLLVCVELNDIFAYMCGKTFGRRKLCPNTSPNKTIGGAAGALVLTTILASVLAHFAFRHTILDHPAHLLTLGIVLSMGGQFGDLLLSSVKRDLGIKDMGNWIPGHGGLLDRFDSVLLVSPAVFHYIHYFKGIGLDQPTRIFSGG